jgi:hypothetical protein
MAAIVIGSDSSPSVVQPSTLPDEAYAWLW